MKMQIKKLFLKSKVGNKLREIQFQEGKVNFIIGNSLTGKTAIIFIIDYILGAENSQIPSGIILETVDWFGMECSLNDGNRILIARRNPSITKNEVFFSSGKQVTIPTVIKANLTLNEFKEQLNKLVGLPEYDFKIDEKDAENNFKSRASFRDLAAFIYQPQYIIANPTTLFFKTESFIHRERLKASSELILNIIDVKTLEARDRIYSLQEKLDKKIKEKKNFTEIIRSKRNEIENKLLQATKAGLWEYNVSNDVPFDILFENLKSVVANYLKNGPQRKDTTSIISNEISNLQKQEQDCAIELQALTKAETRLKNLIRATEQDGLLRETLNMQVERLEIADGLIAKENRCPFCNSEISSNNQPLKDLQQALKNTESTVQHLDYSVNIFSERLSKIKQDIQSKNMILDGIHQKLSILEEKAKKENINFFTQHEIARLIGSIEEFIEFYSKFGDNREIDREIYILKQELEQLKQEYNDKKISQKRKEINEYLSNHITDYASRLNVEYPDMKASFDWKSLTIKLVGKDKEERFLSSLGSGANWVSYHIASILALAVYFTTFPSYVPSFLILDQPSQVYFPTTKSESNTSNSTQEDTDAVKDIFKLISTVITQLVPSLQVIILEHAGPELWENLPNVYLAANWKEDEEKLIPSDWLRA